MSGSTHETSRSSRDRLLDLSLREWALRHQHEVMERMTWMGVPMRKSPLDAWIYQELVHRVRPDVIVEIGAWAGGSTLCFARLLDLLGAGTVLSIDIARDRYIAQHPRIVELTGDSSEADVLDATRERCIGQRTLIDRDRDHNRDAVLQDLRAYGELVSVVSYLVVEDGILDLFPVGTALHPPKFAEDPLPAIEDFLAEDDRFEVDATCERYLISWNPSGFLRRVR